MKWKGYNRSGAYAYTLGLFPTMELLAQRPQQVREVLLASSSGRSDAVARIRARAVEFGFPVTISDKGVQHLARKENTYAVGVFEKYWPRLDEKTGHVILVNPADMGNLGTILRTMVGFGFFDLALIRPAADVFDPRTVRASMGALFQARFAYFDTFEEYAKEYPRSFYPFMTGGAQDLAEVAFQRPFSLVFGSEGAGLPPAFNHLGRSVRIPQHEGVDSLNLPVAVGIALYETEREKNKR